MEGSAYASTPTGRFLVMDGRQPMMSGGGGSSNAVSPAAGGGAGGQLVLSGGGGGQPLPKTLNEMEAELQALQKENFDLKMTIFYQKEVLERLQGCAGPDEMREVLGERQRELEEALKELEYRLQEKDAQLDEMEALLAQSRAGAEALQDDLRRLSLDQQHLQQEAQAAEARHAAALAGKEQGMRAAAQGAREAEDLWAARCRALEEEVEMGRRERASLSVAAEQGKREAEQARGEAAAVREELRMMQKEAAASAASASSDAATATATAIAASRLLLLQQHQQQHQQPPAPTASAIPSTEQQYHKAQAEEWRARGNRAEERVRELEIKLGAYQNEVRELQQQVVAAQRKASEASSGGGSSAVWKERMELAQRELVAERTALAAREASLRNLEREVSAAAREREQLHSLLRAAEAGEHGEARHLREQLAVEKRGKDALLLDMAEIRRHGKTQLRELLDELKQFDRTVDQNFADLLEQQQRQDQEGGEEEGGGGTALAITTPLKQLLAAEEAQQRRKQMGLSVGPSPTRALSLSLDEADRSTSQQASGKMLVQQARELVRKWRLKLQALPSLNRQLKEAMARAARGFESRMLLMTERVALQERQLAEAERALQAVKEGRCVDDVKCLRTEAAQAREREMEKAKRATQRRYQELLTQVTAEKNALEEKCRRAQGEGKEYQELVERQRAQILSLTAGHNEVKAEARQLRERLREWEQKEQETAEACQDRARLQKEMGRLLHQLEYRDEVIAVLQQALASHGLDKQPTVSAQLALLQRRCQLHTLQHQQSSSSAPAGAQSLTDLLRAELEQTAAALLKQGQGQGTGAAEEAATATALEELARQAEAMRGYLAEAQALVGAARAAMDRFTGLRKGGGGGKLEEEVASLLEANARLTHLLRGVCIDIQRLFRRLAPSSAQQQQPQPQRYGSPLRAAGVVSSPAASASASARPSPYPVHHRHHQPQRSRTVLFGSPAPAGAAAAGAAGAAAATGPSSPGHHRHRSVLAASHGSQQQRVEELFALGNSNSNGGLNSAESSLGGSGSGHYFGLQSQGVSNLQKIQNELVEIQAKLSCGLRAGIEQVSPLKPRQQQGGAAAVATAATTGPAGMAPPRLMG